MTLSMEAMPRFPGKSKITILKPGDPIKIASGNPSIRLLIVDNDHFRQQFARNKHFDDSDGILYEGSDLNKPYLKSLFSPIARTFWEHILFVKKELSYAPSAEKSRGLE
ncbi:MAG: hypothetical protein US43_C0014G0006 [Candidatus Levybacteria bacterium GW2011_GWA1_37_16]|nr:MAG: hypothetical protein US43_C0014G0006 [Candidatus Levybacteria bacterium GW2011_GWA1_37_16]KKQ42551.1 MAG: hypothetical protein US59_C0007G0014 [Candidatus Levybacteria bacterium GW2011_GWB1_37_8]